MTVSKDHRLFFVNEFSSFRLRCICVCVCVRALEVSSRSECVYWSEVSLDLEPPTLDTLRQSCPSSSCPRPSPARLTQRLQSTDNTHLQLRTSAAHTQILTDTHTPLTMRNSSSHERTRADTNPHTGTRTHLSVPTHLLLNIRSFFSPSSFSFHSPKQPSSLLVFSEPDKRHMWSGPQSHGLILSSCRLPPPSTIFTVKLLREKERWMQTRRSVPEDAVSLACR